MRFALVALLPGQGHVAATHPRRRRRAPPRRAAAAPGGGAAHLAALPGRPPAAALLHPLSQYSNCWYFSPVTAAPDHGPESAVSFWDAEDPDTSVGLIRAALQSKAGVVLGFDVTDEFESGGSVNFEEMDGVMKGPVDGEETGGGHAIHVVGYISVNTLFARLGWVPDKYETGYFIVRNSWGKCWGDEGYVYMPVSYVKKYVYSAWALYGVQ